MFPPSSVRFLCLAGLISVPVFAVAQGGPPMLTDDPGTPELHKVELNIAYTSLRSSVRTVTGAPLLDFNYGQLSNLQLKIETPYVFQSQSGNASGVGPTLAGAKWRFQDEKGKRPAISTFPQVQFSLDKTAVRKGVADAGTGLLLPIEVLGHKGGWGYNFDLGGVFQSGANPGWLGGLAVSKETKSGEFVGEMHFEGDFGSALSGIAQFGYRRDLGPTRTLMFAIGRSVVSRDSQPENLTLYVGVQVRS